MIDLAASPPIIGIVLFDGFETLDVFGPIQMLGRLCDRRLAAASAMGAPTVQP